MGLGGSLGTVRLYAMSLYILPKRLSSRFFQAFHVFPLLKAIGSYNYSYPIGFL
jgi:hypothetical protein